jgi:hypothetical protein
MEYQTRAITAMQEWAAIRSGEEKSELAFEQQIFFDAWIRPVKQFIIICRHMGFAKFIRMH